MYFPYFRGKQYELITIRENARRLAAAKFVPVIEPVKESLGGLDKALGAVCDANGSAIVVVNPFHGSHRTDGAGISSLLKEKYLPKPEIAAGVMLTPDMTLEEALSCCDIHQDHDLSLIHSGFSHGRELAAALGQKSANMRHLFVGEERQLYQRHFSEGRRITVKDGFRKQKRNSDYPGLEKFSELHITYSLAGLFGFGDFLTVGDDYTESGGPAYSIAIHLTFIDPGDEDVMYIHHFKSLRSDTPADPAGKFAEALDAMIRMLDQPESKVLETEAVAEFRSLHNRGHFPGLGSVKKLSMQHHIETLAHYFSSLRQ
jgi:hypothetical protein